MPDASGGNLFVTSTMLSISNLHGSVGDNPILKGLTLDVPGDEEEVSAPAFLKAVKAASAARRNWSPSASRGASVEPA